MYDDNKTNAKSINCTEENSDRIIGAEKETGWTSESCKAENDCSKAEIIDAKTRSIDNIRWYMHHLKNFDRRISEKEFKTDCSLSAFPCFAHEEYSGIGKNKIGEAIADALHNIFNVKRIDFRNELRISAEQAERYDFSFLRAKDAEIFRGCTCKYLMTLFPDARTDKELFISEVIAFDNIVSELKRKPARAKKVIKPADAVFLKGDPDRRPGCNPDINAILSTSGSKYKVFKSCIDVSAFEDCFAMYELCARTAIGSLLYAESFDDIICFDTDAKFANFFYILSNYPDKLDKAIKNALLKYDIIDDKLNLFQDEKVLFRKIQSFVSMAKREMPQKRYKSLSVREKIKAAAYLYLLIHFTTNGFMIGYNQDVSKSFMNNLEKRLCDIQTQVKVISEKGTDFNYINESWLNNSDLFISNDKALAILDLPHIHPFGLPCYDYDKKHPFTWNHVTAFLKPFNGAKCKCILFCSDNLEFEKAATAAGFKKARYYDDCKYRTIIYTLNISDAEADRVFINLGRFE